MSNLNADLTPRLPTLTPNGETGAKPSGDERRAGSAARLNASQEAMRALPSEFVKQHRVLPLDIRHGTLHVATAEPGNQRIIDDIRLLSGLEVQEFEASSA